MTSFLNSIQKRKKTPDQLVVSSKQALQTILDASITKEDEKAAAVENLNKYLVELKNVLYGSVENVELDEEKVLEASKYIQSEGLIKLLISNIDSVSFEARKDTALIYNNLVRKNVNNFAQYLAENVDILQTLLLGYLSTDSALSCGSMLRESIRHESLARYILFSDSLWAFFDTYVHLPDFEVASDAFNTLRDLLTLPKHKHLAEEFMETHCDKLLEKYDALLQSENYVTRRRSLKLLSELLLDRSNYTVMMKYISSKHHLKTIMNLLRHKSTQIQFETFHVFKIFVANPSKTAEIEATLSKNKSKLIAYLEAFHTDNEDPQFVDEKRLLIDTLQQLVEAPAESPSTSASHGHRSHSNSLTTATATASASATAANSPARGGREGGSGSSSDGNGNSNGTSGTTHTAPGVDSLAEELQHRATLSDASLASTDAAHTTSDSTNTTNTTNSTTGTLGTADSLSSTASKCI